MAIEGTLDLFQLPEILQVISQQGKTGILTVQGEADIVAISFEEGKVVAADALNQTLEESLGEVLSGQGLVSPSDFAAAAAEHQAGNGRFLDLLVERAFIDRQQLLEALRFHTYRLLIELLSWRAGEFKFYGGDEVSYEEGFKPISVEELLIRSVEEAAGEGHPTIPDSRSVYEPTKPPLPIRVRKEGEEPAVGDDVLWLTEAEKELLEKLSGGVTVAALVKRTRGNEYKVRYVLHRLLEAGVVRRRPSASQVVAAPPPAAPASRPVEEVEAPAPAPAPVAVTRPLPERRQSQEQATVWLGRILALLPLAMLLAVLVALPASLPLPFPWQVSQRQVLEKELRSSLYLKLDRALKTFYLLEGQFPPSLSELVELGLLAPADLHGPLGRPLAYLPGESSYILQSQVEDESPSTSTTEAVTGNFLLDPEFLAPPTSSDSRPLVLLD